MRGTYCVMGDGRCEDVLCKYCPQRPRNEDCMCVVVGGSPREACPYFNDCAVPMTVWDEQPRVHQILEGVNVYDLPTTSKAADPADVTLFTPDNVMRPAHYSQWAMEPIEFIAINNLPWWLANIIKYTMRFEKKDGLQDLYKARSYLEMKIAQLEGTERFWDKPVNTERTLNDASQKAA